MMNAPFSNASTFFRRSPGDNHFSSARHPRSSAGAMCALASRFYRGGCLTLPSRRTSHPTLHLSLRLTFLTFRLTFLNFRLTLHLTLH